MQREIASHDAAFGAAVADLATILELTGHPTPYDTARSYVEQLQRDGWKWRPREPAPPRPSRGAHIPASEHDGWRRWREKTHAEIERARAEFEAREAGRDPGPAPSAVREAIAEKPRRWTEETP